MSGTIRLGLGAATGAQPGKLACVLPHPVPEPVRTRHLLLLQVCADFGDQVVCQRCESTTHALNRPSHKVPVRPCRPLNSPV